MNRVTEDQLRDCVLLYVEDDDATAYLFQLALEESGIQARCFRVTDGHEALDFVLRRNTYADAPRPDLIVLDINLPKMSGLEVLAEIRRTPELRDLSVAVCTSSSSRRDRQMALELGANAYIVKGLGLDDFIQAVAQAYALIPRGRVMRFA